MTMPDILDHLLAPGPLLAVWAGAVAIACIQQGLRGWADALRSLRPMLRAKPEADRDAARALLYRVEAVAELKGLATMDRIDARHPFLTDALRTLANARDSEHFRLWLEQALADRTARHGRVTGWWNALADAAPACGMAGTVVGLIAMFASMSDPSRIGPAMALALLTTLHGLLLANVVAGPIANRLARLSAEELAWQRAAGEHMLSVAQREAAPAHRAVAGLRGAS